MRQRLDVELARRGLASSRRSAQLLIMAGLVRVNSRPASKPDLNVTENALIEVLSGRDPYASRGAHKLQAALDRFPITVAGRLALDVGASTGGFTDLLLSRGARQVIALDVGYGQLAMRLRTDPRVIVMERCNVRFLTPQALPFAPELITIDASFISLRLVLPAIAAVAASHADIVPLIKPQFEVGKGQIGKGGVVRDIKLHQAAVEAVLQHARELGFATLGTVASPLKGPAGNQEYLAWLRKQTPERRSSE
ncbi:MAG TPA: TlyA family RNA methyltransferase [Candidatus Binataceae bacterium]|nr:TlyA family RNA methyltransferase [Candidatus Binataceae bacterium]